MNAAAMALDAPRVRPAVRYSRAERVLHLFTLSGFAVAQPFFDRLANRPIFLSDQGIQSAAIVLFTAAVLVLPPVLLLGLEFLAGRVSKKAARRVHLGNMGLLLTLIALEATKGLCEAPVLHKWAVPGIAMLAFSVAVSVALVRAYRTSVWMRRTLRTAAVGLVVFPAMFLTHSRIATILAPPKPEEKPPLAVKNPVPVVVIVFDEFCGMSLLNEERRIDAVRFPNFAALTRTATWYRNATTVHPRTDYAVPAILSGRFPDSDHPPTLTDYPQNLFTLMRATRQYDMTVFEPATRLCPEELAHNRVDPGGCWHQVGKLLSTVGAVYANGTVPADLPVPLPAIPRSWFGMNEPLLVNRYATHALVRPNWGSDRSWQFERFLQRIEPAERPHFYFLHVVLPHYPWSYLPSGSKYLSEDEGFASGERYGPLGTVDGLGELWGDDELIAEQGWQRYLLQLGHLDALIGQLMERLRADHLFDESLLILMGDHGVSFTPRHSRRSPSGANLPEILSVPLFVKLPHQHEGGISDRNVESIDVLPTIAEVLGMELPQPVDGESFLTESAPRRPRKTMNAEGKLVMVDAGFPARFTVAERLWRTFGTENWDQVYRVGPHQELVGQSVSQLAITPGSGVELESRRPFQFDTAEPVRLCRCLYEGAVRTAGNSSQPLVLAAAVNGRIVGVTRTYRQRGIEDRWTLLLPEASLPTDEHPLQMFVLREANGALMLEPCPLHEIE